MKLTSIALTGVLLAGCSPTVKLTDYECSKEDCTKLGKELTGSQRPKIFLTEAYHPESDSASYELRWRDTTTTIAHLDSSKANLAIITYFIKTGGKSQMRWDLSQYNNVQDFTLTVRAHGYKERSETWHVPKNPVKDVRVNIASR